MLKTYGYMLIEQCEGYVFPHQFRTHEEARLKMLCDLSDLLFVNEAAAQDANWSDNVQKAEYEAKLEDSGERYGWTDDGAYYERDEGQFVFRWHIIEIFQWPDATKHEEMNIEV